MKIQCTKQIPFRLRLRLRTQVCSVLPPTTKKNFNVTPLLCHSAVPSLPFAGRQTEFATSCMTGCDVPARQTPPGIGLEEQSLLLKPTQEESPQTGCSEHRVFWRRLSPAPHGRQMHRRSQQTYRRHSRRFNVITSPIAKRHRLQQTTRAP